MEQCVEGSGNANSTALVLMNTRLLRDYVPIEDMFKPDSKTPWGNYFTFMHVPIPKLDQLHHNSLQFVSKTRDVIKAKKTSLAPHITARVIQFLTKLRGSEVQ